jgi:hypothetical protein
MNNKTLILAYKTEAKNQNKGGEKLKTQPLQSSQTLNFIKSTTSKTITTPSSL